MSDAWIDAWLGSPRFQKYVDSCAGDRARALALYEWNVTLGQALMRDIAHFEIALRNAYNMAFAAHWPGSDHWLLDPDSPAVTPIWRIKRDRSGLKRGSDVNYLNRRAVDAAIRSCGGARATPGKVMAELSFGFWRHLTSASHEKTVWVPYLHHASRFDRPCSPDTSSASTTARPRRNRVGTPLIPSVWSPSAIAPTWSR